MEGRTEDNEAIRSAIRELAPWFHNLHLPQGVQTAPDHFLGDFPGTKWRKIAPHIPDDLRGKTVLDVGCNAGFYSLELASRGAEVTAIDLDPLYLRQGKWAAAHLGLSERIQFRQMQVYDLSREETSYDIVWFMGVFYHLRYPLLALDILAERTRELMVFQSMTMPGEAALPMEADYSLHDRKVMCEDGWPKMAFIETRVNGDPTNWWAPNHAAVISLMRTCGYRVTARPAHEIYLCEKDPELISVCGDWNRSEYLSAIGRAYTEELPRKTSKS